jgi:hypothetical protein
MKISIPMDKLDKAAMAIKQALRGEWINVRALAGIVGKIISWSQAMGMIT